MFVEVDVVIQVMGCNAGVVSQVHIRDESTSPGDLGIHFLYGVRVEVFAW